MKTKYQFDKFMNDIVKREQDSRPVIQENDDYEETVQRRYHQRYAEKWQNRIKYSVKDHRG